MVYIALNLLPILAATLAGLAVGALCYRRAAGHRPGLWLTAAVAEFWLAAILAGALILAPKQAGAWTMALATPVVIWIGFVVPALVVTQRVRGSAWRTAAIDCAHWLAVMVVQAAVLGAWGLVPPPA